MVDVALASIKPDFDGIVAVVALLLSGASVWTALKSNKTAERAASDARTAAREARNPALDVRGAKVGLVDGAATFAFDVRNVGKGIARVESFAVRSGADAGAAERRRWTVRRDSTLEADGDLLPPDEGAWLAVDVDAPPLLALARDAGEWVAEVVYTDRPPTERFRTRTHLRSADRGATWRSEDPETTHEVIEP